MGFHKLRYIILLVALSNLLGQVPSSMQYTASLRDDQGELLNEVEMELRASIIRLESGEWVTKYAETHIVTTTKFGEIYLNLGEGLALNNSFAAIQWSEGAHFIRIERIDGPAEILLGSMELLAVPYAFYAKEAGTIADNAMGKIGTQGESGGEGLEGEEGATGVVGVTGPVGVNGGIPGPPGPPGANGSQGPTGPTGLPSAPSANGSNGPIGPTGPSGPGFDEYWLVSENSYVHLPDLSNSILLQSPNGQCWKIVINNNGIAETKSIVCPN